MFVTRSRYDALHARYEGVLNQRDTARRDVAAYRAALHQAADQSSTRVGLARIRDAVRYGGRIDRLCRAVAALRTENAKLRRTVARLQAGYDSATGLDSPALDLGAHWQERRSDKPRPKAVES
ncbi:hypothetical protein [Streptomyces sp. NPDC088730]|uniref:hypothetical protein n=1 Tax=Streptomyces sp. NPDC088730 TaxID=3365877 RepID=UPI00382FA09A